MVCFIFKNVFLIKAFADLKKIVVSILVLSILSFQWSELLVFVTFKLNQDFIAKNLCVEKDVEGSTCKGCCQLKKKVNEQQEQKEQLPPVQDEKQNINFCGQITTSILGNKIDDKVILIGICNHYQFLTFYSVFHPPQA